MVKADVWNTLELCERKILHNHSRLSAGIDRLGFSALSLLKNASQAGRIDEYRQGFIEKEDEF